MEVIWGDGSENGLLLQEEFDEDAAFVAATGYDDRNLALGLGSWARALGPSRASAW